MEFLSHMPVFFWVILVFMVIGGVYRLVVGVSTQQEMAEASALAQTERWQESASIYRKLILERLDFPDKAKEAAAQLVALYRAHGVDAQLSDLEASMKVLDDIENASVSDRKKVQMRTALQGKLASVLGALPPASEADGTGPDKAGGASGADPGALDADCRFCDRKLVGQAWKFGDYVANEQLQIKSIIGYVCPNCGAVSHKDCPSGIAYKLWSGYEKSRCLACENAVHEPTVVFPG